MKRLKDESGQALIITALCMTCLFGFAALAADVGLMFREKRLLQIAADSAAIAGALELKYYPAGVTAAAKAASAQNGFTDGTNGATVTVSPATGPVFGAHQNDPNYVEVIISQSQPTLFMNFLGIASMTPRVRAVAQNGGSSYGCLYALSPTGTGMSLQGKFNLDAPNCGVIIDSNDPTAALSFTGKAGTITAGSVGVVGGVSGSSNGTQPVSPIVPQSDPLAYLIKSFPTPTGCIALPSTSTISPGCYSGNVTLSNVTLSTGTFIFTGNVTLSGNVTTGPGGATLDLNSGSLTQNTNSTLNLVAPTTGTFHGIAIMAPPTNKNTLYFDIGMATGTIDGIIYAPGATLSLQDNGAKNKGGLTLITDLVVGSVDSGPSPLTIQSYSQSTAGSPLTKVSLVE